MNKLIFYVRLFAVLFVIGVALATWNPDAWAVTCTLGVGLILSALILNHGR